MKKFGKIQKKIEKNQKNLEKFGKNRNNSENFGKFIQFIFHTMDR